MKKMTLRAPSKEAVIRNEKIIDAACLGNMPELQKRLPEGSEIDPEIKGYIISYVIKYEQTAPHTKARHDSVIKFLITKGASYMMFFVHKDADFELMKRLIELGAKADVNYNGFNVLHNLVVQRNTLKKIDYLVQHGADINSSEKFNDHGTPLHILLANELFDTAKAVIRLAQKHGKEIDYNVRDSEGKTCLILAAKVMSLEMVNFILARDASCINASDHDGCTALHYAAALGRADIVAALIEAGANIDAQDNAKRTPHDYADFNEQKVRGILKSISMEPERDIKAKSNYIRDADQRDIPFGNTAPGTLISNMGSEKTLLLHYYPRLSSDPSANHIEEQLDRMIGRSLIQACMSGQEFVSAILSEENEAINIQVRSLRK